MDVNEELKFLRKFKKKKLFGGGQWKRSGCGGGVRGGQGGCERRIEVFVKIKKKKFFFGGGGGGGGGVGSGGSQVWRGLVGGGGGGQGGCERNVGGRG